MTQDISATRDPPLLPSIIAAQDLRCIVRLALIKAVKFLRATIPLEEQLPLAHRFYNAHLDLTAQKECYDPVLLESTLHMARRLFIVMDPATLGFIAPQVPFLLDNTHARLGDLEPKK